MITVTEATQLIQNESRNFGTEKVLIDNAFGRFLAEDIVADRDFPPFDRVTMDGIAIDFEGIKSGNTQFLIQNLQAAGDKKQILNNLNNCIEVMTGAIMPENTDSVIKYEDLDIIDGIAIVKNEVRYLQNVHFKGEDRKAGDLIAEKNIPIKAPELAVAASVGLAEIHVKKLPKIVIITSGDEIVSVNETPKENQIRSSNVYAIQAELKKLNIKATTLHISDDLALTKSTISNALEQNDILILSGGVSMGKKDFIPQALEQIGVQKLFHKLQQTPGKPFWFGKKDEKIVFALPGNPVSTHLCTVRYILPWLLNSFSGRNLEPEFAQLSADFQIKSNFTYFLQVSLKNVNATLMATPIKGNGSGDFANLVGADAYLELPAFQKNEFKKGEVYPICRF